MKTSCTLLLLALCASATAAEPKVTVRPDGLRQVHPAEVSPEFQNPWTPEMEEAYLKRYNQVLEQTRDIPYSVNTYFENEKRTYGYLMMNYLLTGNQGALDALQGQDHQHAIWHKETAGIDWYACFTIKHQTRKYFYFGDLLRPQYRDRMKTGGDAWTEQDPLRRPHYAYKPGTTGWGPDAKNSWVDVRTTDNLWWMRCVAVYLMAEETGNQQTAEHYKNLIRDFVVAQYRSGTGEWDSHNYFGHAAAPVHSLYDFAKDPEVKQLAKASLDHYYTAAALKTWRGGWNGPNKRDYNAVQPLTAAPAFFSLLLGLPEGLEPHMESDHIHVITSAYRPPQAVMALAAREGMAGTEIFASHAPYSSAVEGRFDLKPEYHETQYYGENYQLGTLARGTQEPDANGFKLLMADPATGAEMLQVVPGTDPLRAGSPQYSGGKLVGNGRVAHYENLAVYLVNRGDAPWTWVIPNHTHIERVGEVMFTRHADTWTAWQMINAEAPVPSPERTEALRFSKKRIKMKKSEVEDPAAHGYLGDSVEIDGKGRPTAIKVRPLHSEYQAAESKGKGGSYCGLVLEVGEPRTHQSYEAFKKAVLEKSSLDLSNLSEGSVIYQGSLGKKVELHAIEPLSGNAVVRDGQPRSYSAPYDKYRNANPDQPGPVQQNWTDGTLEVTAGGKSFRCTVTEDGRVSWENN